MKSLHLLAFALVLSALNAFAQNGAPNQPSQNDDYLKLIGQKAPELELRDILGNPVKLSAIKTPYLVIYFWDPICPPCLILTPKLDSFYVHYLKKNGCEVLGINTNTNEEKYLDFTKKHKMNWVNVWDPKQESGLNKKYNVNFTPVMYILDKNRKIVARARTIEELKYTLDELTKEDKHESTVKTESGTNAETIGIEQNLFNAFPNPFDNGFTLYLPEFTRVITVKMYSMEGKEVVNANYQATSSVQYVATSTMQPNLAAGTYIVNIETDKNKYTCKMVKQ